MLVAVCRGLFDTPLMHNRLLRNASCAAADLQCCAHSAAAGGSRLMWKAAWPCFLMVLGLGSLKFGAWELIFGACGISFGALGVFFGALGLVVRDLGVICGARGLILGALGLNFGVSGLVASTKMRPMLACKHQFEAPCLPASTKMRPHVSLQTPWRCFLRESAAKRTEKCPK